MRFASIALIIILPLAGCQTLPPGNVNIRSYVPKSSSAIQAAKLSGKHLILVVVGGFQLDFSIAWRWRPSCQIDLDKNKLFANNFVEAIQNVSANVFEEFEVVQVKSALEAPAGDFNNIFVIEPERSTTKVVAELTVFDTESRFTARVKRLAGSFGPTEAFVEGVEDREVRASKVVRLESKKICQGVANLVGQPASAAYHDAMSKLEPVLRKLASEPNT